jgi:FkbM family methyltransferase
VSGAGIADRLTWRQRATWLAHLWKAATQQHHGEMAAVFRPRLPRDGVVLDVGGHSGQFTKLFAGMVPDGQVHTFEPGSYALSLLRRVVAVRRLANVSVHPVGLGDVERELVLNVPVKRSGSVGFGLGFVGDASGVGRAMLKETIPIRRLDDVIDRLGLARVDLIKADIEGSELRMLVGAERTLRRFRPALFLEVSEEHLARHGDSVATLTEYLRGLGYRPQSGWSDAAVSGDVLFVADQQNLAV